MARSQAHTITAISFPACHFTIFSPTAEMFHSLIYLPRGSCTSCEECNTRRERPVLISSFPYDDDNDVALSQAHHRDIFSSVHDFSPTGLVFSSP